MSRSYQQTQKIKWRCRRGMLELDLLLKYFVDSKLDSLNQTELDLLEKMLDKDDDVLQQWLVLGDTENLREFQNICRIIRENAAHHS